MSMGNKFAGLTALTLLPLLISCRMGTDQDINDLELYNGCYYSDGIIVYLEDGTIKSQTGRYIYSIKPKKIGMVLASNFYLKRNLDNSLEILPNNYEKFYLIQNESIRITDSRNYIHLLKRTGTDLCDNMKS